MAAPSCSPRALRQAAPPTSSVNRPAQPFLICPTCDLPGDGGGSSKPPEIAYIHSDPTTHVATVQLDNGVTMSIDAGSGIVEVFHQGSVYTMTLASVISEATGKDSAAAAALYANLQAALGGTAPETVIAKPGYVPIPVGAAGFTPFWDNDHNPLDPPTGPYSCGVLPPPCNHVNNSYFGGVGGYNTWWSAGPGGSDNPGDIPPPDPNNCPAFDIACKQWERDRQDACDSAKGSAFTGVGAAVTTAVGCATAFTWGGALVCAGGLIGLVGSGTSGAIASRKCLTPYPGMP